MEEITSGGGEWLGQTAISNWKRQWIGCDSYCRIRTEKTAKFNNETRDQQSTDVRWLEWCHLYSHDNSVHVCKRSRTKSEKSTCWLNKFFSCFCCSSCDVTCKRNYVVVVCFMYGKWACSMLIWHTLTISFDTLQRCTVAAATYSCLSCLLFFWIKIANKSNLVISVCRLEGDGEGVVALLWSTIIIW